MHIPSKSYFLLKLCVPHQCQCGEMADPGGHHGLVSCRHFTVNDIICRALKKAVEWHAQKATTTTGWFVSDRRGELPSLRRERHHLESPCESGRHKLEGTTGPDPKR